MDINAYGGAALGIGIAARELAVGHVSLSGALCILPLSADFFPARCARWVLLPCGHERHGRQR